MIILRFRSKDEHRELLNKVKQMNRYTKDIEECLEEAMEDDVDNEYRYRRGYEDDDDMRGSRYSYRRGRM